MVRKKLEVGPEHFQRETETQLGITEAEEARHCGRNHFESLGVQLNVVVSVAEV